ncbi:hypothetical protein RMATCC62417_05021 [Rhizopus microsporus]|nr:hypothetical protein RMATCC62417_05021 [Rhizopus microsporus]CEI95834.1 hypothetical protein RMCBS344292_10011 [Rhizopus microsporus]
MSDPEDLRTIVNQLFVDSGEKEKLLQWLEKRLVEIEWNEQLSAYCREIVRTKHMENATFEQIYEEVEDYANSIILESIKVELLEKVKKFIDENVE